MLKWQVGGRQAIGIAAMTAAVLWHASASAGTLDGYDIGDFGANVTITSDYVFRGVSQTNEDVAIQGGIDWSRTLGVLENNDVSAFASVWASSVGFGPTAEVDLIAGLTQSFGNTSYEVGGIWYLYPGSNDTDEFEYYEIYAGVSHDFDFASLGASIFYSPDYFGGSDDSLFVTGDVAVPLPYGFTIDGNLGYFTVDNDAKVFGVAGGNADYLAWGVGLELDLGTVHSSLDGFSGRIDYIDTDLSATDCAGENCDARAVFSLSASF